MVEEKPSYGFCSVVVCGHGFQTFGEIVNNYYDLFLVVRQRRVSIHKVDATFAKETLYNDRFWRSKRHSCLVGEALASLAPFGYSYVIVESGGKKITSPHEFLGCGHPCEVAATSPTMAVI